MEGRTLAHTGSLEQRFGAEGEGGGREGPRNQRKKTGKWAVGFLLFGSSGEEGRMVLSEDASGLSTQLCRVWDHLHKYCLQKAISGSFTCSEVAICTFFSGTISSPICTNSMCCNWPWIGQGGFLFLVFLVS